MATNKFVFSDCEGNEWDLTLTLETHARLRKYTFDTAITPCEVSIISPSEEFVSLILSDAGVLFDVIPAILKPQIDVTYKDIEPENRELAFLSRITGDVITKARECFVEALGFFCPTIQPALQRFSRLREKQNEMATKRIAQMEPKVLAQMEMAMDMEVKRLDNELAKLRNENSSESSQEQESAGKKRKS